MRSILLVGSFLAATATLAIAEEDIQPWNGSALSDWTQAKRAVVITDMTRAEPADVFSAKPKRGHWQVIPYEMRPDTGGYKGKAIWCGYEANPPEVKLRLGVSGWHAIFVGIPYGTADWLKLDQDKAPLWRSNGIRDYYVNSADVFFKVAELDKDSRLIVRPQRHGAVMPAGITHILLVPLTAGEIERLKRDRSDTSQRTMVSTYDGFSPICGRSPRTREELLAEMESYRHTDFGTIILHGAWGGDKTSYPTKVGHMPGEGLEDVAEKYHRDFLDSIQALARQGINPLKVMIEGAHDVGMKVHVGIRPAGWSYYEPYNGLWDTPFYLEHPEWRCVDRVDLGSPQLTRMSWAVPEVRLHIIEVLAEEVSFGADGAHIVFNRGFPMVLYEKPFCDMFMNKYGEDPNKISEEDPRVLGMRSDIIATFFRELRVRLQEEEKRRGDARPLQISVMVLGTDVDNRQYGVDVRRLAAEKLIDVVYVYPFDFGATKKGGYDAAFFKSACTDQGVPHFPTIDPPYDIKGQLIQALKLHESGGAGLTFWDAGGVDANTWAIQSRLGHLEETRWRARNLDTEHPPHSLHFYKWWGAHRMDVRFPVYWGG